MKYQRIIFLLFLILSAVFISNAQTQSRKAEIKAVKSSPAYAEVLYRQVLVRAELEDLLVAYTNDYPKVRELRIENDYLKQEMERLLEVDAANAEKLSPALGKLIVGKVSIELDLWKLLQKYNEENPEVKKVRRKIEIFENAIKEIL